MTGGGRPADPHDPSRPAIADDLATRAPTVRIGARDRWPLALTGLIALFLGAALAKPWAETALAPPGPPAMPPAAARTPSLAPSIGPDPRAALREHCQDPLGWRVYSRELWNGRIVRTWRSVEPANLAVGPADPAIPVVELGPSVEALGYCSPWSGIEQPPDDARVAAWRLELARRGGDPATPVALVLIGPHPASPLGALYGSIGDRHDPAAPGFRGWPAGRYVFTIGAAGWQRWWAVEIAEPDGTIRPSDVPATPTSTPATAPDSSPLQPGG